MKASLQQQPMYCSRDHNYTSRLNQQYEKSTQYSITKFCNSPSLIFISGSNSLVRHFTLYFTKSHSCSVFSFSHCTLSIHSDNLFSASVHTSPTFKCTKIWYGQSWHDVICAYSLHMTYLCVGYLIFLCKCFWVCMWTVTYLSIIYTNAKYVLEACLSAITQIINMSLTNGEFCENWKVAVVKPLLKKPGLNLISKNHRPISSLPFISKLVEKCMLKQLMEHCENHNLLPDFQSAYRKHYSMETSLIRLTNDILWSLERQHITSLAILDLLAAFDTIDHNIFLHILEQKFGFCGRALKWFQNYLRPQSFTVNINGKYLRSKNLEFSVPQGSCSGANLFTCYCSLITDSIPSFVTLSGFADDHSIRRCFPAKFHTAEKRTISTMENTLTKVANWMTSMQLKLNSEKTKFILFGSRQMLKHADTEHLNFGTTPIQWSNLIKYLGGYLVSCLTFKEHVKQKCKAAMLNFIKIKTIRPSLTASACHTLVLMLCISHLDYANALLYGMTKKLKSKYQRIQNMCAKLVLNKEKYDSATKCLQELHWLPIKQRIQHKILLMTHKALSGQAPKYIQELIKIKTPCRQLKSGHSGRLLCTPSIQRQTLPQGHSVMLHQYYGTPYHSTLGMRTPLPHSRSNSKHISLKKPSTCKAHEIVSHWILIIALYQMLCYVMLCYMSNRKVFQYSFLPWDICINILSFCSVLTWPCSTDKYIYTHMIYDKKKNINHKSYHYMLYKCNIIHVHIIW